jgi:hypothetical protein
MILRRITEHVKAQNWFAVAIDFVIVVVGVFVGIQVSNWNASRVERAQEQAILVRLVEDYRQLVEREGAYLARSAQRLGLMAQWIDASERGELRDLDQVRALTTSYYEAEYPARARSMAEATVSDLFTEPFGGENRPEASITFQQLVASGDLKLIRSEPVRRALASRSAQREEANLAIGFNHGAMGSAYGRVFVLATFQAASPNAETVLEAALAEPGFAAGLRGFFGVRSYNDGWYRRVHAETQRVLAILETEAAPR